MSYASIGGAAVTRGRIGIPRVGVWNADVVVDTDDPTALEEGAQVTLDLGDGQLELQATVRRAAVTYGTTMARLVGGAGGLPQLVAPKAYQGVSLQVVLEDLLEAVGEQLSAQADPNTLGLQLPFWLREGIAAYRALGALVGEAGVPWRTLPDGSLWLGPETWPAASISGYDVLAWDPSASRAEFTCEDPSLWPGQTWEGGQVSRVEHAIDPHRLRTRVWFEDLNLPPS